jgi:O-antigen ligase
MRIALATSVRGGNLVLHLAGIAMLFSTAVQLRFSSIGVGELAGVSAVGIYILMGKRVSRQSLLFMSCGLIVCLALFFGGIISLFFRGKDFAWLDLFGIFYAFSVVATVVAASFSAERPVSSIVPYLLLTPIIQILLLILNIFGGLDLSIWFAEGGPVSDGLPLVTRFVGWATFPNQLGIAISGLPFLIILLLRKKYVSKIFAIIALISTIIISVLIMSNTVFIAWLVGLFSVIFARGFFNPNRKNSISNHQVAAMAFSMMSATLIIVMEIDFFSTIFDFLLVKGEDSDLNGRLPIWMASIEAWIVSPIVGLGPGAHAMLSGQDTAAESHLLFLDLLTQGGIVAAVSLICIFVWSIRCAIRTREELLIGLVMAAGVESLAHNTQRHPIFWLFLALPAVILYADKCILKRSPCDDSR